MAMGTVNTPPLHDMSREALITQVHHLKARVTQLERENAQLRKEDTTFVESAEISMSQTSSAEETKNATRKAEDTSTLPLPEPPPPTPPPPVPSSPLSAHTIESFAISSDPEFATDVMMPPGKQPSSPLPSLPPPPPESPRASLLPDWLLKVRANIEYSKKQSGELQASLAKLKEMSSSFDYLEGRNDPTINASSSQLQVADAESRKEYKTILEQLSHDSLEILLGFLWYSEAVILYKCISRAVERCINSGGDSIWRTHANCFWRVDIMNEQFLKLDEKLSVPVVSEKMPRNISWQRAAEKTSRALAFLLVGLKQLSNSCAFSSDTNRAHRRQCTWVLNYVCILTCLDATPRGAVTIERLWSVNALETFVVLLQSESQHIQSLAAAALANLLAVRNTVSNSTTNSTKLLDENEELPGKPTASDDVLILKPHTRRLLVSLITSPSMNYLAMPTAHAARSLVNAFVYDRALVIKACSAGELGGFGGNGQHMNIPDAGSNFPLVRKQEPVKWDTSLGNFHNLTHWCIEYFNATGTMSHIAFTTIRSQQDGRIEGIGADARDTFNLDGSWKCDTFSGSLSLTLHIHYHGNHTIRYRDKGNVCHLGWWCEETNTVTGSSSVPGSWGTWENTSAAKHHELRHGGVFRLYPMAHREKLDESILQRTVLYASIAESKFTSIISDDAAAASI